MNSESQKTFIYCLGCCLRKKEPKNICIYFADTILITSHFRSNPMPARFQRFLAVMVMSIGATSCAQYQLVNRANPYSDWNADVYACNSEAVKRFPPAIVTSQTTQSNPYAALLNRQTTNTTCMDLGIQVNCTSTTKPSPYAVPSTTTTTTSTDANKQSRDAFAGQCLSAKGWRRERVQK